MLTLGAVDFVGSGLSRPECALAHESGLLFVPDWRGAGGVAVIGHDGTVARIEARGHNETLRPNGIALEQDGSLLLAHLGAESGGVFRLAADGTVSRELVAVDGRTLPPTNFVMRDRRDRLWVTVSTRRVPRDLGYRPDVDDGFIVCRLPDGRTHIAADGLGYTNECVISGDGETLFVNETFGRRLTRFRVRDDGTLAERETVATFPAGTFPDGLALDVEGGLWIASIVSNRVIRVDPATGAQDLVLEDADADRLADVEAAFLDGRLGRPHLDTVRSKRLKNISNIAFGGSDLRTAYLGCLLGEAVATFRAPVAGLPLPHWTADVTAHRRLLDDALPQGKR